MAEYKLYCLDRNGRIAKRLDIEAADDAAAIAAARDLHLDADCELWCGARMVAVLPAADKTAA